MQINMALEAAGYCEQLHLDPAVLTLVLRLHALMASHGLQRGLSLDQVNQKFICFIRTKVQMLTLSALSLDQVNQVNQKFTCFIRTIVQILTQRGLSLKQTNAACRPMLTYADVC
jgi:hypothetical protein